MVTPKDIVQKILSRADVTVNGSRPWDIQIHDEQLYKRVLSHGSVGLGESYMDGWWDAVALDQLFDRVLSHRLDREARIPFGTAAYLLAAHLLNLQRISVARSSVERHYDKGNDLYQAMLDSRMQYSCGYWKEAKNLEEAQTAKLDLTCRKLGLQKGMKLLDIGCGWGGLVKFAVERYGVEATGITLSTEQANYAKEITQGLPITIALEDYRTHQGLYDRIVSVGMFEHVGVRNYREFMNMAERCLTDDELFLLHTIGGMRTAKNTDPWIHKYIFPNSMLPSLQQISAAAEGIFINEDVHNFGADYDPTLMAWFKNFDAHWPELKAKYGDRFYRMWKYYLLSCAGGARSRYNQLWQIVFSKHGVKGGYRAIR